MNTDELNEENQVKEVETEALTDLAVENEEQVKGGPSGSTAWGGSSHLNHNETTAEDEEGETETLTDLEPEGEVKGGGGPDGYSGSLRINHNETAASDEGEQNTQLTDLEPQNEVKGGGGARITKIVIDNDAPIVAGLDSRPGSGVFK